MRKNITPLLKPLRISSTGSSGGSLYVFPSACEDIGLNINGGVNNVNLSHYALLNIPPASIKQILFKDDDQNPAESGTANINITSDPNLNTGENISDTPEGFSRALIMSLQNYAMNFDVAIMNQQDKESREHVYNFSNYSTYAEPIFWKWLSKTKLLKLSNDIYMHDAGGPYNIFQESSYNKDNDVNKQDNTIVKCLGSISGGNNVQNNFGMYNETYITIPTSYGAGPVIFSSQNITNISAIPTSIDDTLEGLGTNQYMSYLGYDKPFYDENKHYDIGIKIEYNSNPISLVKDPIIIARDLKKFNNFSNINTDLIQSYDDINIDMHNQLKVDTEFDFNAILLYYSIFDETNNKTSKIPQAINLFGILFLDAPQSAGTNEAGDKLYYISSHKKTKSTEQRFGNSFSFRVNLNTLPIYDNTDAIIQDSTTNSGITATETGELVSILNKSINVLTNNTKIINNIQSDYKSIKEFYKHNSEKIDELSQQVDNYVKGKLSNILNIDKIYAKNLYPIDNEGIRVYPHNSNNLNNDTSLKPLMTIDTSGVNIGALYTNDITTNSLYVHPTMSTGDSEVTDHLPKGTLNIFSGNNLKIKKQSEFEWSTSNSLRHNAIYNKLYIDAESPIFSQNATDFLGYLKNNNNEINYIGLIPHIIAYLQNITSSIGNSQSQYTKDSLELKDLNIENLNDNGTNNYISITEYFKKLNLDIMNIHSLLKDVLKKIKNN